MEPQNEKPIANTTPVDGSEKSIGPAIGIIIIIAVIVIGGLYFWGQRVSKQKAVPTPENNSTTTIDQNIQNLQKQSSADDINSIEADLNATNLNQLGSEMNGIEAGASAASASVTP
jgi:flagellar basal body-associated protein FliL